MRHMVTTSTINLRSRSIRIIRLFSIAFVVTIALYFFYHPIRDSFRPNLAANHHDHASYNDHLYDLDVIDPGELDPPRLDVDQSGSSTVRLDHRGLFEYRDGDKGDHPILRLIARGKQLAQRQDARIRAVTDLNGVVADYVKAFNFDPPLGIDAWYAYTRRPSPPSVQLPSLLPLAHSPFRMFLSLPGSEIRKRIDDVVGSREGVWSIVFVPDGTGDVGTVYESGESWDDWQRSDRGRGKFRMRGEHAWGHKANMTLRLMLPIIPHLPEDIFTMQPPLEIVFSIHDAPSGLVSNEFRQTSEALASAGQTWDMKELEATETSMKKLRGLRWACDPQSPLAQLLSNASPELENSDEGTDPKTFIGDFQKSADYCQNPDLLNYHNMYLNDPYWGNNPIRPLLTTCRFAQNSDLLTIPMDNIFGKSAASPVQGTQSDPTADPTPFLDWDSKTSDKVHWRGSPTGAGHHRDFPWRKAQRDRLQLLAQNTSSSPRTIVGYRPDKTVGLVQYPVGEMNERWLDVGLVRGQPGWCKESDGTCDEVESLFHFADRVPADKLSKSKYLLDVDGNGWSSRFRRLLSGNNVVIKSTIFTEWFHEMLIPWYHYVPTQLDYSDLYDIMAFFTGDPAGIHPGYDELAKEIAQQGRHFQRTKWREEDMQSYLFLMILEWGRMFADDRAHYTVSL